VRVLGFVLLLVVFLAARPPATLVDAAVDRASDGALRLAQVQGSLWRGSGALMVIDPVTQRWQNWLELDWDTAFAGLWRGAVRWHLAAGGSPLADFELSPAGLRLSRLQVRGPARYFLERIPGPLGRAGWEGDIAIDSSGWNCTWSLRCEGSAELRWYGASSDLLQKRRLGDYDIVVKGSGNELAAHVATLAGDIQVDGDGRWLIGGAPSFAGTLRGDPVLLDRLPSVAGRWVSKGAEAGVWRVTLP
jgi:general secretion pathway protein N